jgi:PAS domain S-box-containing protein
VRRIQSHQKYVWLPGLITTMTVVAVVIGLLAFRAVETRQIAMTGDNLALTASAIADNLDEFLDERLGNLGVAAKAPVFRTRNSSAMTDYLEVVRAARHNAFVWLGVTDAAGRIIASTNPAILGQDRNASTWFQAVHDTGAAHVGNVNTFTESGGVAAVSFTVPIMDPQGKFLGTVTAQVGIPALEEVLTRTVRSDQAQRNFSGTLEYQFLLRNGYAFVDSDLRHKGNVNLKRLGLRSAFLAESDHPGYIEEEHLRRHVPVVTGYARTRGYANAPDLQWGILVRVDQSDVLAPTRTALQHLAIPGVIVWMPMFALLLWATNRLRTEWRQAQDENAHARAAEAALRESEHQARAILDGALDAIIVLNSGGKITDWNPRAEAIFGWTRDEAVGRSLTETIIPLQYRNAHELGLRQSLAGAGGSLTDRRVEMTALRRDGTEFPVELAVNVLKNETTHRFTAFITDITERKRTEEALRESERIQATLLSNFQGMVYRCRNDRDWTMIFVSEGALALTGYAASEFLQYRIHPGQLVHPDDQETAWNNVQAALQAQRPYEHTIRIRTAAGEEKWVWEKGRGIYNEAGTLLYLEGFVTNITEHKQAEAALRDSQERFRKAFDEAPIGMALVATDGRWLQVNQALCQIVGYTEQEMLSSNFQSITHLDDLQSDLSLARQLLNGEIPSYQMEKRYIHKLGHVVWIQLTGSIVSEGDGTPLYFIAQIQDITERKQAEDLLRGSEQSMRAILNGALDAVISMDEQGVITDWNSRAEAIFGWPRADAIGRNLAETIIPPRYREQHHRGMRRFLDTGEGPLLKRRIEMTALRRDGTEFPVELAISVLKERDASRFTAFIADITERKQAREALAASEKRLRTILEAEPECVTVTTEDGVLLDMNAAGLAMFEAASLDQVRGQSVLPNIAPDYRDAFAEVVRRAFRGDPGTLQFVIIGLKGKRRWLEAHTVPLRDEHNATIGVLSISRDITERKRAEDALRSSERVLRTLLKEREQLMQDLHDGIIQSLYAIGMSIEECRRLVEEDPKEAKLILEQEIADVNAVIREVRSHLAQGENDLPLSASRFKAELTRVAGIMERANALHFRLKVDQRAAECLTTEERRELLYIAQEAMSNCLRHSNASVASVSLRLGRDRVCLEVEDDGTGFDKQILHEAHGGLRNIERRAAKVGAKIEIVSYREHGTRIRLDVPIHTSPGVST